ncbi:MAG: hypothetical protein WA687_12995 [Solirubrobacterales bacterium]
MASTPPCLSLSTQAVRCRRNRGKTNLDYVLERGGTDHHLGIPVAFIETAWRRYTKHSRNKAQEIQGAVLPLLTSWAQVKPFAGVVLAGVWTQGSLDQLRSNGFSILHIPYETMIDVFQEWDIEIYYEESSSDNFLQEQIDRWHKLSDAECDELGDALRQKIGEQLDAFMDDLSQTILRRIERISILPLHGSAAECITVGEAISLIKTHDPSRSAGPLVRFEVIIRYDNGDRVTADFASPADAIAFLESFQ